MLRSCTTIPTRRREYTRFMDSSTFMVSRATVREILYSCCRPSSVSRLPGGKLGGRYGYAHRLENALMHGWGCPAVVRVIRLLNCRR